MRCLDRNNVEKIGMSSFTYLLTMLMLSVLLSACGTVTKVKTQTTQTLVKISETTGIGNNPADPLEGFNRSMFSFNEGLDNIALRPVAKAYQTVMPNFVQTAVGNFFSNAGDVWTAVNNLLQGNVTDSVNDVMRFAFNSTFGLAGLIDIASEAGMPKHRADFGQTLGVWGVKPGPYVVLPLFGASTLRDAIALPVDLKGNLINLQANKVISRSSSVLRIIDRRAASLEASRLIEEAALDKYVFVREAYLQRRASQMQKEDE